LRCVDECVQMLAPHQVTVQTQFAKGNKEVNNGIEFAKSGLWDKAQAVWEEVLQKDPQNDAAWYNLGLAAEVQGYYLEAQDAYDQAVTLKPKKLYMQSLKRIREHIEDHRKLQEQLRKQNLAEPDEDM
jgi:tetratricopeptide (TPR) repeat protein